MKVAVIIPTYNEKENIRELVSRILKLKISGSTPSTMLRTSSLTIIIVDDNSPDGTGRIVDNIARKNKRVYCIHRKAKLGLGTAYIAGYKKAFEIKADVIITMDADLSHTPEKIPQMLSKIPEVDVVIGSRHINGGRIIGFDWFRTLLSASAQAFARYWLGLPTHDSTSGFRAYKAKVLKDIKPETIRSQGYSFLIEAIYRAHKNGFKIAEVPITFEVRRKGKSKLSEKEIYRALETVIRLKISNF